jgi:hypothetical protein
MARARRWSAAGSYHMVSRVNGTSRRSIGSSSGASRWVSTFRSASSGKPSFKSARVASLAQAWQLRPCATTANISSLQRRARTGEAHISARAFASTGAIGEPANASTSGENGYDTTSSSGVASPRRRFFRKARAMNGRRSRT